MNFNNLIAVIKSLTVAILLTALLIIIFSFIIFKTDPGNSFVRFIIPLINILSCLICGLICSHLVTTRKIIWSAISGSIYFVILLIVSLILNNGSVKTPSMLISTLFISIMSACVGSFLSVSH